MVSNTASSVRLGTMTTVLAVLCLFVLTSPAIGQVTGYYRQPDIHANKIVFNAEGDLWTVAASGGMAHRLTTHPGQEEWPTFSPDGEWIAFSGSYEGASDTYVMPASGGTPKRISWDGTRPVGWTPSGEVILRTSKYSGLPDTRLITVNPKTAALTRIPLSQAAEASIATDGTVFFARMARQGSNSRWYKGGTAQKLWKFSPNAPEAEPLTTDYPGTSRQPNLMDDGRLYFLSDRQGAMNVWSMSQNGSDHRRVTDLEDWDIQELAGDGKSLVYRLGADIWTLNPLTAASSKVPIALATDSEQSLVDWETEPWNYVSDLGVSADGKQIGIVSRGELFIAPVGKGRLVHASRNSGVRYRDVMFGSDSTTVFALSDRSGELEWWRVPVNGIGAPTQVSDGPAMLRLDGLQSPDGKYIAHRSRDNGLWLVDVDKSTSLELAKEPIAGGFAWSPDSRYIVYTKGTTNLLSSLVVYDVEKRSHTTLTSDRFTESNPAFSSDGDWLYFTSSRTWNSSVGSPWGERAPQPHFENRIKIYAIPLRANLEFPLAEPTELSSTNAAKAKSDRGPIRWDLGHLLRELPIPAGSYSNLMLTKNRLVYSSGRDLMALDLKPDAEPIRLVEGAGTPEYSLDGKYIAIRKGSKVHVIESGAGKDVKLEDKNEAMLNGWKFSVDKRAEWTQIFNDMWRLHRDYFWDPNMHGVDWVAMRDKYAPLVAFVGSREELADLQAMLVSELSLLHSNAGGGDVRRGENSVSPAALGGRFERDAKTGGFKLVHRYAADPDLPDMWSPLAHPDVQIEEGSVILSINGRSSKDALSIGELLMDQAGEQVLLTVQDPGGAERTVVAEAISSGAESSLRYHEWEYTRRLEAEKLSDGKIGYVHLRAMGSGDIGQWTREFYSQTTKQGLIVDVRHNNGGNIDSWVLSQLLRKGWAYFQSRTGETSANMQYSFNGHLVVLVDERTASDGEAFADGFTRLGLGESIGVRTWGGEVWLSGSNRQVDGGVTRASETGVFAPGSGWLIEGWGFVPSIEVDNLPHATYNGRDAQLEAAVAHLKELIAKDPRETPKPPPYPTLIPGSGFPTPYGKK